MLTEIFFQLSFITANYIHSLSRRLTTVTNPITVSREDRSAEIRARWGLHPTKNKSSNFWETTIQRFNNSSTDRILPLWHRVSKLLVAIRNVVNTITCPFPPKGNTSRSRRSSTTSSKNSSSSSSDGSSSDPDPDRAPIFTPFHFILSSLLKTMIVLFAHISNVGVMK